MRRGNIWGNVSVGFATDRIDDALTRPVFHLFLSATTGMARLRVPPHIADAVLNHKSGTIKGVAAVYNRHAYLDERREALEKWEAHVWAIT